MIIIIIDFGSQTTHLISRRIQDMGVKSIIIEPEKAIKGIKMHCPKGIIFSGEPSTVYKTNSPTIDKEIFNFQLPILGICYGQQLLGLLLGGKIKSGKIKEYCPASAKATAGGVLR